MEKQPYKVTREDIEWAGGSRVREDGTVRLTEAQAEPELARGHIVPAVDPVVDAKAGKKAKGAPADGEAA